MKWEHEEIKCPSFEKSENIIPKDSVLVKEESSTLKDKIDGKKFYVMSILERSRQDVIKKSTLRMIKRFYHRIFLKENERLSRRRFKNVQFFEIYNAAKRLVKKYFKIDEDKEDLARFIAKIIGVNSSDQPMAEGKIDKEACNFKILTSSFSNLRFSIIQDSNYFKEIVNYIAYGTLPDSEISCYDYMLEIEAGTINRDAENYTGIFVNIVERVNKS